MGYSHGEAGGKGVTREDINAANRSTEISFEYNEKADWQPYRGRLS